jgi:hypothetical protein
MALKVTIALLGSVVVSGAVWAADAKPRVDSTADAMPRGIVEKELAAAQRQMQAPPATTIYSSVAADGTLVVSDQRPSSGTQLESYRYPVPQDDRARAAKEREYWAKQAAAFNKRQQERSRELDEARQAGAAVVSTSDVPPTAAGGSDVYHGYGWLPPGFIGPVVPFVNVAGRAVPPGLERPGLPVPYGSLPSGVQGRAGGGSFIGSGFQRY